MRILSVELQRFRNYTSRRFDLPGEGAVFCGPNGCGKTNLFEAMAYFAFGRSFRTRADQELVTFGERGFYIACRAQWGDCPHDMDAAVGDGEAKRLRLDEARVERISDLYRWLRLIYLSPADIEIAGGAAGERRRFLDQAISQCSFAYVQAYRRFQQVLKQRNALLHQSHTAAEKRVWDEQFCVAAAALTNRRLLYLEQFSGMMAECYRAISGAREELGVRYVHGVAPDDGDDLEAHYRRHTARLAEREAKHQRTLLGPHLDDLLFLIDGKPARAYASQGQRRSLAIAARLAQSRLIESQTGEAPVLVFDDVLAELDERRAAQVLAQVDSRSQVFVATPDCRRAGEYRLPVMPLGEQGETS